LTRFLADEPNHGKARFLRARARAAQGKHRAAADDYTAAIAEGTPRPELYFERARSVLALGPGSEDEALRGLDEGCDRLGTPVVLVELAITIEAERGNHAAAVTRLDALPDTLATSPAWLKRRADLLRGAGRPVESSVVYVIALWRITELQAARRNTPAMKRLEAEVRAALGL
jgi:predicted Zn-dependent protease